MRARLVRGIARVGAVRRRGSGPRTGLGEQSERPDPVAVLHHGINGATVARARREPIAALHGAVDGGA